MVRVVFLILFSSILITAQSQDVKIELGSGEIGSNQAFTITVSVRNDRLKSYENFPDIEGLAKRGTSSSSSTNIVNGQISTSQSVTMNYIPLREGSFILLPFSMKVNGKEVSSQGKTINVGPAVQRRQRTDPFGRDPFADLFNRGREPNEFIDIKDDAFLALSIDKEEVYLGEGFTSTLAFYVSEANRAPLQFYDLGRQVSEIVKSLKPSNCWEENFNIENISGETVSIAGQAYTQYKIYQAVFYPLNEEPIHFPAVNLELIKFKVAKNPSFFGQNRKEDYKTFTSKPKTVIVKSLPPHPLKDLVSVGDFRLDEKIDRTQIETSQSFNYQFRVFGEGNISSINMLPIEETNDIDIYDPNIQQKINRRGLSVTGSKTFSYYGIPKEPGEYDLGRYFNWVYFNTKENKYDTLTSQIKLKVTGESRKNEQILSNDLGPFYDLIDIEDNTLKKQARGPNTNIFANIFILAMLVGAGFVAFKK